MLEEYECSFAFVLRVPEPLMKPPPKPSARAPKPTSGQPLAARKAPKQARSEALVAAILEGAIRVLQTEGAAHFTTVRVAAEAGVSVGSLYQYFPNKEAILFRLQTDEWTDTWSMIDDILGDAASPPEARLRRALVTFFRSEREEAPLRRALDEAGASFRDGKEARALRQRATLRMGRFVAEAAPDADRVSQRFATEYILAMLAGLPEALTSRPRARAEIDRFAHTTTDLLWSLLTSLPSGDPPASEALPQELRAGIG
jgi:AcrR family transcriptional regulator